MFYRYISWFLKKIRGFHPFNLISGGVLHTDDSSVRSVLDIDFENGCTFYTRKQFVQTLGKWPKYPFESL